MVCLKEKQKQPTNQPPHHPQWNNLQKIKKKKSRIQFELSGLSIKHNGDWHKLMSRSDFALVFKNLYVRIKRKSEMP